MKLSSVSRILFCLLSLFVLSAASSAEVLKIVVNDAIHPITDEYIGRAIAEAARNKDQALLIEINTPGGLLDSTRDIIEKILASPVPVIIYVTPSGSRAASAASRSPLLQATPPEITRLRAPIPSAAFSARRNNSRMTVC